MVQCGAVWCSVVQCGAAWCSVVQRGAAWCSVVQCAAVWFVAACFSILRCVEVCCSVSWRVAVCCSAQCVAVPTFSTCTFDTTSCHHPRRCPRTALILMLFCTGGTAPAHFLDSFHVYACTCASYTRTVTKFRSKYINVYACVCIYIYMIICIYIYIYTYGRIGMWICVCA